MDLWMIRVYVTLHCYAYVLTIHCETRQIFCCVQIKTFAFFTGGGGWSSPILVKAQWMIDDCLPDAVYCIVLLPPLSASLRTSGYSLGPSQTSDGLFINPHGGQSRPDENSVQTIWTYPDCIHLVLWREGERMLELDCFHRLIFSILYNKTAIYLVLMVSCL